jgi:hypothetical protein
VIIRKLSVTSPNLARTLSLLWEHPISFMFSLHALQINSTIRLCIERLCRSQWPRSLKSGSAAERLLGLWVRIPPGAWMFVSCECLCCQVEVSAWGWSLVQRNPTECGVSERDCEASIMRRPWPTGGCCAWGKIFNVYVSTSVYVAQDDKTIYNE